MSTAQRARGSAAIDKLPQCCVWLALADVRSAELVATSWRAALRDESLWRREALARAQRGHDDAELEPVVAWRGSWRATLLGAAIVVPTEDATTAEDAPTADGVVLPSRDAAARLVAAGQPALARGCMQANGLNGWTLAALAARSPRRLVRCVAQGEPCDVRMTLADFARYVVDQRDAEPLYVIDDRVAQDGPGDGVAYPPLPSLGADDDVFAALAADPTTDDDALTALARERRYVLAGPRGAGSRWHVDPDGTDAWNVLLSGRKTWAFSPPSAAPPRGARFAPRLTTATSVVWTTEPCSRAWFDAGSAGVVTQEAGDAVYVPADHWHATLCEETCVAVTQNVVVARNARSAALKLRRSKPALARAVATWAFRRRADSSDDD